MNETLLRQALAHLPLDDIQFFESIDSTNNLALQMLEKGYRGQMLIVANTQTAGRGRMNRRWITQPGSALAFSLALLPAPEPITRLPFFAPLAGMAVCHALETLHLTPEIKWPNDVLLNRRKVCGVLVESTWQENQPTGVVIGIGVNVASSSVPPDSEVMYPAGCVEQALGGTVERLSLLKAILNPFFALMPGMGKPAFIQAWESRLAFRGEKVRVEPPGQAGIIGVLCGIDDQGSLILHTDEELDVKIPAGDVARLRPLV